MIINIIQEIFGKFNYYIIFLIMFIALFNVINKKNLLHKLFALSIFQSSVIFLYISFSFAKNTIAPLIVDSKSEEILYANPLPQVLMLTAIVVGVATFAVGLAILLRINHNVES